MQIDYTAFGKTRKVEVELHNMGEGEQPEAILWVERGEDYYALLNPTYKGKKVAIVTRSNWLNTDHD
jgi:hypothetical protein